MFKIVRFPARLEKFFGTLADKFLWDHFEYFRTMVLLIGFATGPRNVSSLYRHLDERHQTHRTRFNNFLLKGRWDPADALATKAYDLLRLLNPRKGEIINFIIDDSKKQKRGKTMEAVGWVHDPVSGRSVRGHQYVKGLIEFRGFVIPFGIHLYVKKEHSKDLGVEFKKTTQLAAELISSFEAPEGVRVRVLFDSYYLCPVVVGACRRKGFRFFSTLKSNRNLFKNGRKLKVGKYGRNLFKNGRKKTGTFRKSKRVSYEYIDCQKMKVGRLGELHVIFSRRKGDKNVLGLVTDEPKISARGILTAYSRRWSIEVFFKDTKQLLGLGQYQNASYKAAVTHLHLVCFAYALLTHIAIKGERAQGKKKRRTAAPLSTADLQNELRRIVWDDLSEYLKELPDGNSVIKELGKLLVAA
ncbi:MAG: transposase [Planctomycetes bacterium]|nr:transposase [Planctomycetota bacterium]